VREDHAVEVPEARTILGVSDADGWDEVRASYRRLIRVAHPDVAHGSGPQRAARLNEAYAVLRRAVRSGIPPAPGTTAPPRPRSARQSPSAPQVTDPASPPSPAPPRSGARALGDDTILLAAPPDEAFGDLLDAGHRIGSISYVDRSCAIFEVIVHRDGEARSLVVTVQPQAHGTEALLTVESLGRVASHSPEPVLHEMLAALR
jgi:hypothetical protein